MAATLDREARGDDGSSTCVMTPHEALEEETVPRRRVVPRPFSSWTKDSRTVLEDMRTKVSLQDHTRDVR